MWTCYSLLLKPLVPLSSVSPDWPTGVGNCASCGQLICTHKHTDREKTMEMIPIGILNILTGIYLLSFHLSKIPVFTGLGLAHCLALPALELHLFFSTCVTSYEKPTLTDRLGWQGTTLWAGGKSKEGLSLASHWGDLLYLLPNHQLLPSEAVFCRELRAASRKAGQTEVIQKLMWKAREEEDIWSAGAGEGAPFGHADQLGLGA